MFTMKSLRQPLENQEASRPVPHAITLHVLCLMHLNTGFPGIGAAYYWPSSTRASKIKGVP